MDHYIGQKAQQALEALCENAPLKERLHMAQSHLKFVSSDHYLNAAPDDVKNALRQFVECDVDHDPGAAASLLQSVIENTFREFGRLSAQDQDQ